MIAKLHFITTDVIRYDEWDNVIVMRSIYVMAITGWIIHDMDGIVK